MNSAAVIDRQTSFENLPELLTPAEARAFLGFSRSTMYQLIRKGEISARRIGRKIFVCKATLMSETPEALGT